MESFSLGDSVLVACGKWDENSGIGWMSGWGGIDRRPLVTRYGNGDS